MTAVARRLSPQPPPQRRRSSKRSCSATSRTPQQLSILFANKSANFSVSSPAKALPPAPASLPAASEAASTAETTGAAPAADATDAAAPFRDEDLPLIADFISEADSHIETAEGAILELEDRPEDVELINSIFRSFHTIKGVAGFLNLVEIGRCAHAAENLLDLARHGELTIAGGTLETRSGEGKLSTRPRR